MLCIFKIRKNRTVPNYRLVILLQEEINSAWILPREVVITEKELIARQVVVITEAAENQGALIERNGDDYKIITNSIDAINAVLINLVNQGVKI